MDTAQYNYEHILEFGNGIYCVLDNGEIWHVDFKGVLSMYKVVCKLKIKLKYANRLPTTY